MSGPSFSLHSDLCFPIDHIMVTEKDIFKANVACEDSKHDNVDNIHSYILLTYKFNMDKKN